jgi:predicted enzyme related to lactoylglutathione lyase
MSDFNSQYNRAVWFDIPVADLDREAAFYRAVLGVGVSQESFGEMSLGVRSSTRMATAAASC